MARSHVTVVMGRLIPQGRAEGNISFQLQNEAGIRYDAKRWEWRAISAVVAQQLYTLWVGGSNPSSPTNPLSQDFAPGIIKVEAHPFALDTSVLFGQPWDVRKRT